MSEQGKPLAPAAFRYSSEENGEFTPVVSQRDRRRRKGLICCGCCAATTLIIGLIILILAFTAFKVKSPKLTFNTTKIEGLDVVKRQGVTGSHPGLNMSFVSDISIKNPNVASFKFTNATTELYYGGEVIGQVTSPPGNVGAQKMIHMNVTINMMVDKVTHVSRFTSDFLAGTMPLETYTGIHGRVNVMSVFKKHVDVELRCTMNVVLSTQSIADKVCKRKVHL